MEDITVEELKSRMDANEEIYVLDVREKWEYDEFNINSLNIPLGDLIVQYDKLPADKSIEIVTLCKSGIRSNMAKQLLHEQGYTHVRNLLGGMVQWKVNLG